MKTLRPVTFRTPLLFAFVALAASAAWADCDSTGHGAPGIADIVPTATSITVSWLSLCPAVPNSMQIREGGTSQMNFQDGALLGTESLQPNENGGAVTANNLTPATSYLNLRLCAIYSGPGEPPWCTGSFGAATSDAGQTPTPVITQVITTETSISFSWNGGTNYAAYNVSILQSAYASIARPNQTQVGGGFSGQYTFSMLQPATSYEIAVQGCIPGGWNSLCSTFATKTVTTSSPPPPAALPPENLHTLSNSVSSIMILWTNPPGVLQSDVTRMPGWMAGAIGNNIPGGIQDDSVVSGELYTYQVCLKYQSGQACGTTTGQSQVPPPVPTGCVGQSLTYGSVEVMCYTYSSAGVVGYDAVDPMDLQRLDANGTWTVVDDGVSNPWDVPPPRSSIPFFQDNSFQTNPSPPSTATYRVVASNQWANSPSPSFTVTIDLKVQPVISPGPPICGPLSKPYRRCMALALGPQTLHSVH